MNSWRLSHPRRPLLWLAAALGGTLLLALLLAQAVRAVSHTAVLTTLTLGGTEVFMADVTMYKHTVYDGLNAPVDMITVVATADDSNNANDEEATADIKPDDADSDVDGHQVALGVGKTSIEILVTSAGGEQTRTYTVEVTRVAASDATLSALSLGVEDVSLSPDFDPSITEYTASVANGVGSTTVTATATHTGDAEATVIQATNGDLKVGENTITVVVRAVDGTTETYTVVVTRAGSDATLTDLTISSGTLAPAFTGPDAETIVYEYTATVESTVTSVTLMATKDATAKETGDHAG